MKDAVMKQLRLLEQSVIHEKIAGFIFSVPIEGRMEPGGTLGKKDSCFFCITGVFCGLFPVGRIHGVRYAFVDNHIFFRKIVIILVIRIEIFEGIPDSVHQKAEFLFLTGEIACGKMEGERLWNGFQKLCLDGEGGFFGVAALEGSTGNAETALQKGEIGKEWEKTGKLEQVVDENAGPFQPEEVFQGALVQMRKAEKLL